MTSVIRTAVKDIPPIGRAEAARLARVEYQRFLDMLRGLEPDVWDRPTDCARWTVKDVAAHIVGETEAFASLREFVHQWRLGPRVRREIGAPELIDGVNEVQVRERRSLSPAQLIERMAGRIEAAVRLRSALPAPVRAVPVPFGEPLGRRSVAYLVDLVITRDVWMHRVDITRVTGTVLELTAEHDGRLVADMVSDWASTHADPFLLELTGPAGGTFIRGEPPAPTRVDAVEFLRVVSGRGRGEGLLAHPLPL
jgi:uncharacterized protein (TIGR03083 family)